MIVTVLIMGAALGTGLTACTKSRKPAYEAGQKPFSFDYREAMEVSIVTWNQEQGESWSARAERNEDGWALRSGPDGKSLGDTVANASFIEHLLDSISALQVQSIPASQGPESQGLARPIFAIRWTTGTKENRQEHELKLGALVQDQSSRGARFAAIRSMNQPEKVLVINGSVLKLLQHLDSFTTLRHAEWATEHIDDVDEAEFKVNGMLTLYAQREGESWTDRNERPLQFDVTGALQKILRARIIEFIEEPRSLAQASSTLNSGTGHYELVLRDRHGAATTLRARATESHLLASHSKRPAALFKIPRETLSAFPPR